MSTLTILKAIGGGVATFGLLSVPGWISSKIAGLRGHA